MTFSPSHTAIGSIAPAPIDRIVDNTIYYQHDPRVPMTTLTLHFHGAGFQQDPPGLSGLARITARTLFRGTPGLTRERIAKDFELLGAAVDAYVTETDFIIYVSSFSTTLPQVMQRISTIFNEALFPQQELELVKRQELNSIEAGLQDHDRVLAAAHEYALYGRDTFGKFGSRAAIDRITRENVTDFFRSARSSAVAYVTAVSDLSRGAIGQHLQAMTAGRAIDGFRLKPEEPYQDAHGFESVIVHSPGAANDRLRWSHRGLRSTDNRRFDLYLIIDALGGFEGFLFDQLRNQRGWCYGAYASMMRATTRPGRIAYYADPAAENSAKLIPEMLRLLSLFPDDPDFMKRLSERNETFKNRYAYQLDIKKKLSNEVDRDRYGIPILDRDEYRKRIDAVNYPTARKVIDDVFDLRNLTMVYYGEAERLQAVLRKVDPGIKPTILEKEVLIA